MDLLNRYLSAVAAQLPERQRDSIALELREELLSRIEERRSALRRPLTEAEVCELLKSYGHPLSVAVGYRHQRHLLSPALLPFYWFATQLIIGTELLAHLAYGALALTFGESPGHVLAVCAGSLWIVSMYLMGVITFSALILDRLAVGQLLANAWSPRWLPGPGRPGQAVLALDVVVLILVLLAVSGAWRNLVPPEALAGSVQIHPGPVWQQVAAWVVLVAVCQLDIHLLQRFLPAWDRGIHLARIIQGGLLLGCAALVARARPWIEVAGLPSGAAQALSHALDTPISIAIAAGTVIATALIARNSLRLIGVLTQTR